jgi:hypothetical protein
MPSRFSLSSDFSKPCRINKLQTKKDSIPIAIRSGPPSARIRRNRQRPPSNSFIERAPEHRANAHFLLECAHPVKHFIGSYLSRWLNLTIRRSSVTNSKECSLRIRGYVGRNVPDGKLQGGFLVDTKRKGK